LRDATGGFTVPMVAIAGLLLLGVILMMLVPKGLLERTGEAAVVPAT